MERSRRRRSRVGQGGGDVEREITIHRRVGPHILISPLTSRIPHPPEAQIATTLQIKYSGNLLYSPSCCIFRNDNEKWHHVSTQVRPFASCLQMITFATGERSELPIIVRDHMDDGYGGSYYGLHLPLRAGLNHLSWCKEMQLGVYTPHMFNDTIRGGEEIKQAFHREFSLHEGPAFCFQPRENDALQAFQLRKDGRYHPMATDYPFVYTPEYQMEGDDTCLRPPHVMLYTPEGQLPPDWLGQMLHLDDLEVTATGEEVNITDEQHQHHLHLRYTPVRRGRHLYTYAAMDLTQVNINHRIKYSIENACMHALWDKRPGNYDLH
jgi:hypothetical protein